MRLPCVLLASLLAASLMMGASACASGDGADAASSRREAEAETLVELRVGEDVTCRDNGAVNTELHPEALVTYICRNERDEIYAATVTPQGELTSLSRAVRLKPASG